MACSHAHIVLLQPLKMLQSKSPVGLAPGPARLHSLLPFRPIGKPVNGKASRKTRAAALLQVGR